MHRKPSLVSVTVALIVVAAVPAGAGEFSFDGEVALVSSYIWRGIEYDDRPSLQPSLTLSDGGRLALVSLDSTSRSNITVGPPYEVAIYPRDSFAVSQHGKFDADHPYLRQLQQQWSDGMRSIFLGLPRFDWETSEPKVVPQLPLA